MEDPTPQPVYVPYTPIADKHDDKQKGGIVLREEQRAAIDAAKNYFEKSTPAKDRRIQYLWNAKMRFGKTICALRLAREMKPRRTLVVTHRPVVRDAWTEDFGKVFGGEDGITVDDSESWYHTPKERENPSDPADFRRLESHVANNDHAHAIYFASIQYLRRSDEISAKGTENRLKREFLGTQWDLLIVDEAHEGTTTELGSVVLEKLAPPGGSTKVLHLSGTPYRIFREFQQNESYTWDYIMEQRAKRDWAKLHPGQPNPYAVLPQLNIFTYDLAKLATDLPEGAAFSLAEFFRTWKNHKLADRGKKIPAGKQAGDFVHEENVKDFLRLLYDTSPESNYPFSRKEYREGFRHTLWVLPGVEETRALEKLLKADGVFQEFTIVNVAGAEEGNDDALKKVLDAIGESPDQKYTITLSCGRLTTGVTVPPWTAVFYLKGSDLTNEDTYLQTIFRVQSPHICRNGTMMKSQCYVFDFAPDRSLKALASIVANTRRTDLPKNEKGKSETAESPFLTPEEQKELMTELLRDKIWPVISLDGGKMVPYKVETLFGQINHAVNSRIAISGYQDEALYQTDKIDGMTDDDIALLNKLRERVPPIAFTGGRKPGDIQLAGAGLPKPQRRAAERAQKKQAAGKALTPEEEAALKALKEEKKQRLEERKNRIAILRAISVRVPLLLYGGDFTKTGNSVSLANFVDEVDAASWAEFMPEGVTKEEFKKLRKFYDVARFEGAGNLYRQWTREADSMTIEERTAQLARIFGYFRNPTKETVLTPWRVVNLHLSTALGGFDLCAPEPSDPADEAASSAAMVCHPRFTESQAAPSVTHRLFHLKAVAENPCAPEPTEPQELPDDLRILDLNAKTGLYPLYLAYTLYRRRLQDYIRENALKSGEERYPEVQQVVWDQVLSENLYLFCITPMARKIALRTLRGFRTKSGGSPITVHIRTAAELLAKLPSEKAHAGKVPAPNAEEALPLPRLVEAIKARASDVAYLLKCPLFWENSHKTSTAQKTTEEMFPFFAAVVGNPPYQVAGNNTRSAPVYPDFYELAFKLAPVVSLITPARFLFKAGQQSNDWSDKMLRDPCLKIPYYTPKSQELFPPPIDIKGGIAISLRDENNPGEPIRVFYPSTILKNIDQKVKNTTKAKFKAMTEEVSSGGNYRYTDECFKRLEEEHKSQESKKRFTSGTSVKIISQDFTTFPEVFLSDLPAGAKADDYYAFYGLANNRREKRWIRRAFIQPNDFLRAWNVLVPKANGSGALGEVLSTPMIGRPMIGRPMIGHTDTFLSIGKFTASAAADACLKYLCGKFSRAMLGIRKVTQDNPRETWSCVPWQDFEQDSPIDWSKSIEEIDAQLYALYELSDEERSYIETNIQPMTPQTLEAEKES